MKLILHDILTEFRHWRWLVVLWCSLVFIDLGYQCEWWWDGPQYTDNGGRSWTAGDELHHSVSSFVSPFLWIGLSLPALFLFLSISPIRTESGGLTQPMSKRSRILSRFFCLVIFVGLPWYLHEWIYVRQMAGASPAIALLAVVERFLLTLNIWFGLAVLGWCSGTIWNALKICAIGLGSAIGVLMTLESIPGFEDWSMAFNNPQMEVARQWSFLTLVLVPAIGLLVCYQLSFRSGISSPFRKWLPIILCGSLAMPAQILTVKAIEGFAKKWAAGEQWGEEDLREWNPEISKSQTSILPSSESVANPEWSLMPSYRGLPATAFPKVNDVTGRVRSKDGKISRELEFVNRGFFSTDMALQAQWLRHLFREFPDAALFTGGISLPVADGESILLSGYGGESPGVPLDGPMEAKAKLKLDLWEMGGAHLLPLSGEVEDVGTLRGARVHSIGHRANGAVIFLRYFQNTSPLKFREAIDPHRLFALWHPETQEMVPLSTDAYPATVRGGGSHLRLVERELRVDEQMKPLIEDRLITGDFMTREWIEQSRLVIIEAKFASSLDRELQANYESYTGMTPPGGQYANVRPFEEVSQELSPAWKNPESTEAEIRRAAYQLVSLPKDGQDEVSPAPQHLPLLRQLALEFPELLSRFSGAWREEDRTWFLKGLENDEESPPELLRFVLKKGWLQNRDHWIRRTMAKGESPVLLSDLDRAVELGIPGAAEMKFRRQLGQFDKVVDPTEFPEIWEEEKARLRKAWEKEAWQLQIASAFSIEGISLARMGEPAPLRVLLEKFLRIGKADRDKLYARISPLRSRWEWISSAFDPEETKNVRTPEGKEAAVKRWLASEWEYQAETMTYRIVE